VFITSIYLNKLWIFKEIQCPAGSECPNWIYVCGVHSGHNTGPDFISNCRFRYIFGFQCSSQVFIQTNYEYSRRYNVLQVSNVRIGYMYAEYTPVTIQVRTPSQIVDSDTFLYSGVHQKYLFKQIMNIEGDPMSRRFWISELDICMRSTLRSQYRSGLHLKL
jgi:hypothetical protein